MAATTRTSRFKPLQDQAAASPKQIGFMPYTLLGWPDVETSAMILDIFAQNQVAMVELGLPFSDPIADGPVIERAIGETLARGFTLDEAWELIATLRQNHPDLPISVMGYYNLVRANGVETFLKKASQAGVDGLLIVDLPPEVSQEVVEQCQTYNIAPIFIASPLTHQARLEQLAQRCQGYVYVVSRLGITGVEERYDDRLATLLETLHQQTVLPCYVGFGVSTPEQAQAMVEKGADGIITGSKIITLVEEALRDCPANAPARRQALERVLNPYLHSMKNAVG